MFVLRALFGFLAWAFIVLAVLSNGIFMIEWTQGGGLIGGNLGWLFTLALNPWTWGAIAGALYLRRCGARPRRSDHFRVGHGTRGDYPVRGGP